MRVCDFAKLLVFGLGLSSSVAAGIADKSVTVSPNPLVASVGEPFTLAVTITNAGPDLERSAVTIGPFVEFALPLNSDCGYALIQPDPNPGSPPQPFAYSVSFLTGNLGAGASKTCTFRLLAFAPRSEVALVTSTTSFLQNTDPTPGNPPLLYTVYAPGTAIPTRSAWALGLLLVLVICSGWRALRAE